MNESAMHTTNPNPALIGLVFLGALFAQGCAVVAEKTPDPLVGQILDMGSGKQMAWDELVARAKRARVIYLGEKHDNPEHHKNQLRLLAALVEAGKQPTLGFEVFDLGQTSYLMRYSQPKEKKTSHAAGSAFNAENWLLKQIDWQEEGDNWQFYGPLLKSARMHRLPTFGADLSRALRARITAVGYEGLTNVEKRLSYPSGFDDAAYAKMMKQTFKASHCGWGSDAYLGRLYDNWVARNDAMAMAIDEMLGQYPDQPVVMILGAGHTRHDRGVVEQVARKRPQLEQLNIGLREVMPEAVDVGAYLEPDSYAGKPVPKAFDVLWLTRRANDKQDPCEKFLRHKKKAR